MRKVKITDIRKGRLESRKHITYAHLVDAQTGALLISAKLDYIVNAVNNLDRKYELTNAVEVLQALFPFS